LSTLVVFGKVMYLLNRDEMFIIE